MAWLFLILGGIFETGFAIMLKESQGLSRLWPSLGFFVSATISFGLLTLAMRTIPIGTAYAVWTGIGAVGTVTLGILLYGEPSSLVRLFFIATLIGSIIGLNLVSNT